MNSNKITFVIPSRNNLEFLKLAYKSIRNLETEHEILVLDDASTDDTWLWCVEMRNKDSNFKAIRNDGPERIGIVGMFDQGIELSNTDIIFAFHADMVAAPDLDKHILKHLKKGTVVSATRVEPPLHPDGPEKVIMDFGIEVVDFDIDKFNNWVTNEYKPKHKTLITEGIFAPWCMYKEDFLAIGGHDKLFAPQSREDSDLFNRFILNGYKVLQTWEGLVYHFTSRGSRFNKHAGGAAGKNSDEWLYTTTKNMRNFIRKWGHIVKHDLLMKPIIPPKYDISFIIKFPSEVSGKLDMLRALEPWCSRIYTDYPDILEYVALEQSHTSMDLKERIYNLDEEIIQGQIIVEINSILFTQHDFTYIHQLSEILKDSGAVGSFNLGNLKITINALDTFEQNLIKNEN